MTLSEVMSKLNQLIGNPMSDQDYKAGMTAAIQAYQASVSYPVTGFSYTYTPAPAATPPAETVPVTF